MLSLVKYTAVFVAALSGAVGIFSDYRDKAGNVTRAGRIALACVVLSSAIAVLAQMLEDKRNNAETLAKDQQTNTILTSLRRSLFRFGEVTVSSAVALPLTDPAFANYLERLKSIN